MGSGRQDDLDYLNGRRRIAVDRRGAIHEANEELEDYNAPPIHVSGMPVVFSTQNTGHNAKIEFRTSRDLCLNAYINTADDEQGTSPLSVAPTYTGTTPAGAVVAVGRLVIGNDGTSRTFYINEMPGQSTKLPFGGSQAVHGPLLVPKYFNADDTNPLLRVYRIGAAGHLVTSDTFSNPQQTDLQNVIGPIGAQAAIFTSSVTAFAHFSVGSSQGGAGSPPKAARRFFGTIPIGAAGIGVQVPVQWGSSHVELVAQATTQFIQQLNFLDPATALPAFVGPFPANTLIPLVDNVQNIVVSSTAAVAASEPRFEVHYVPGV